MRSVFSTCFLRAVFASFVLAFYVDVRVDVRVHCACSCACFVRALCVVIASFVGRLSVCWCVHTYVQVLLTIVVRVSD